MIWYSIVYSLTTVGRLYYTVWSKSAVGNADFVPYSRLWPDGVGESAHYCRRFGDLLRWFLHLRLYIECSPYFYCRFVWLTDLESIRHASTPTSIIPTKFEVDITIHCQVIVFLSAHTSRDLVTFDLWPFDLKQLTCMAGHVTNPATKFEDPKTIRSWVTSYNVSHWLPLKMCTRPLRMRRITWPVSTGSKNNYIFGIPYPDLPIHYTTSLGLRRRLRVVYSRASPMLKPLIT